MCSRVIVFCGLLVLVASLSFVGLVANDRTVLGALHEPVSIDDASVNWFLEARMSASSSVGTASLGVQSTKLFYPFVDFVIEDVSYSGNPFDVVVDVTFTHSSSGETIYSSAFYDGDWDETTEASTQDDWVVRFAGTRLGEWTFTTSSVNSALDGLTGTIYVEPQDNPLVHGGKRNQGNWWTIIDYEGVEKPFIPVIYHHEEESLKVYVTSFSDNPSTRESQIDELIQIMQDNYANVAVLGVFAAWTDKDSRAYGLYWDEDPEQNPQNPDIRSFVVIEEVASRLAEEGMELHLWKWRDEDLPDFATPTHIGGVNQEQDRRLQRYIAARLGPLLNWQMTYGIDMHEGWATSQEVLDWYDYMHEQMGWFHHLAVRERLVDQSSGTFVMGDKKLDFHSDDHKAGLESDLYAATVDFVGASSLPFIYERRFLHTRDGIWDMETTRRGMWQFWMAGGATAVWGRMWGQGTPHYPAPEQIGIFREFWERYADLGYERDVSFTDGLGLRSGNEKYVVYKEDASSVQIDLTSISSISDAVAVDATGHSYVEIDISQDLVPGQLNHWSAPETADWALYVQAQAPESVIESNIVKAQRVKGSNQAPLSADELRLDYVHPEEANFLVVFLRTSQQTGHDSVLYGGRSFVKLAEQDVIGGLGSVRVSAWALENPSSGENDLDIVFEEVVDQLAVFTYSLSNVSSVRGVESSYGASTSGSSISTSVETEEGDLVLDFVSWRSSSASPSSTGTGQVLRVDDDAPNRAVSSSKQGLGLATTMSWDLSSDNDQAHVAVSFELGQPAFDPSVYAAPRSGFSVDDRVRVVDTVVYDTGYYSVDGVDWVQFSLSGEMIGDWVVGEAESAPVPSDARFFAAFSCSWSDSWDCEDTWQVLERNSEGSWSLAQATYSGESLSVSAHTSSARGTHFRPDGSQLFVVGRSSQNVVSYELSSPWDLSSASYLNEYDLSGDLASSSLGSVAHGVFFRPDGVMKWVFNRREIYEYTLSSPWDVSTAQNTGYADLRGFVSRGHDIDFSPDGEVLFIDDRNSQAVFEVHLSSPWDVSTHSLAYTLDISAEEEAVRGVEFSSDGTRMFLMDTSRREALEYHLSSPYDLSTASFVRSFSVSSEASNPRMITWRPNGEEFFVTGTSSGRIYKYTT
jgi:hypothetical protein